MGQAFKIDSANGVEIVDNLTSTDTDKALSANQGRILNEAIPGIQFRIDESTGKLQYRYEIADDTTT